MEHDGSCHHCGEPLTCDEEFIYGDICEACQGDAEDDTDYGDDE